VPVTHTNLHSGACQVPVPGRPRRVVVTAHAQRLRADQADRPRELGAFAAPKTATAAKTPSSATSASYRKGRRRRFGAVREPGGRRAVVIPDIRHHLDHFPGPGDGGTLVRPDGSRSDLAACRGLLTCWFRGAACRNRTDDLFITSDRRGVGCGRTT
jgi:hypothetical protein